MPCGVILMPRISYCPMMPAWHQRVPISGQVEQSETPKKCKYTRLLCSRLNLLVHPRLALSQGVKRWINTVQGGRGDKTKCTVAVFMHYRSPSGRLHPSLFVMRCDAGIEIVPFGKYYVFRTRGKIF